MKFKSFNNWDQLPKSSQLLFTQAEKDSVFFSQQWFENLAATSLNDDQTILLACVVEDSEDVATVAKGNKNTQKEDKDKVLAILPLMTNTNKEWSGLQHIYTSLYSLLLVENNQPAIINCLARGLVQLPFNCLKLGPVAADDENINALEQAMASAGLSCVRYAEFFNWFYPLQGQTFTDYMETRQSRVKNTIARKERKLEREQGYEIHLYKGDDVQQGMADFHKVYKASWKPNERFEKVIEGFIKSFSKRDWIRLAILYTKGQPVAAQIWFVAHGKASIFKLAYDEEWKQYSPGSILTKYLMKAVIDTDKVEEIDFLTGNDHYKEEWMSERRQRWRIECTRKHELEKTHNSFVEWIFKKLKELLTNSNK